MQLDILPFTEENQEIEQWLDINNKSSMLTSQPPGLEISIYNL